MTKYKGTYRTDSTRLKDWDYASPGYYFITICTQERKPFFSQVQGDELFLSPLGEIAQSYWLEITAHFPHTSLDEYVIMPNHVHGIIIINDTSVETQPPSVETQHAASLQEPINQGRFGPLKPGSISTIIRSYKSAVTR